MIHKFHRRRIVGFFLLMAAGYLVIVARLYQIQVLQKDSWMGYVDRLRMRRIPVVPKRGKIYSANGKELAASVHCYSLCADPTRIGGIHVKRVAQELAAALGISPDVIGRRLLPRPAPGMIDASGPAEAGADAGARGSEAGASPGPALGLARGLIPRVLVAPPGRVGPGPVAQGLPRFVWIKRRMEDGETDMVRRLLRQPHFKGLWLRKETRRIYPNNQLLAHVLGFVGADERGLEGLEHKFDSILSGTPGEKVIFAGPNGRSIPRRDEITRRPEGYYDVYLTIDEVIQYYVERELDQVVKLYTPQSAFAIALEPNTGEVLAMAGRPTFDPNNFHEYDRELWRNQCIADAFEPGSTFKLVTAAAALEDQRVDPAATFHCPGRVVLRDKPIRCTAVHGNLTLPQIIEQSCNTGIIKVAQVLGPKNLYYYIRKFGFGQKTGIELPGEAEGLIRPPEQWSGVSIGAVAIGQELSVTAIQMVTAIGAIANGGRMLRPQIIRRIVDPASGQVIRDFSLDVRYRVVGQPVVESLTKWMTLVTLKGTGTQGALDDYLVAGKTGTGEILGRANEDQEGKLVASFIAFLPANDPKVLIYVVVNQPQAERVTGGMMAAPAVREIANQVMLLRKVPPELGVGTPVARPSPPPANAPGDAPQDDEETDPAEGEDGEPSVDDTDPTTGPPGPVARP